MTNIPLPSVPFQVEFEVIGKCNLRCKYCRRQDGYEPSFDELLPLFRKTKEELDPCGILLIGGEPFLRQDIFKVLGAANALFFRIGFSTNGTLLRGLKKEELQLLREMSEKTNIQVSIDSIEPRINDSVRGKTKRVMAGIDILEENRIPFTIGIVLTQINVNSVSKTLKFFLSNYNFLREFNIMNVVPEIGLGKEYFSLRAKKNQYFEVLKKVKELKRELGRNDVYVPSLGENLDCDAMIDSSGFQTCLAGLFKMYVTGEGDVTPCAMLRETSFGNLHTESWEDIYRRFVPWFLSLQKKMKGSQCSYFNIGKQSDILYSNNPRT